MPDIVSREVRSRMMSGIRAKHTKPEMILRRGLHSRGFRYLLHDRRLPGTPDLVLPKFGAMIHAQGCFWHGHDCELFKLPKTRVDFWKAKINRNREVDLRNHGELTKLGWRQAVVWECALKGKGRLDPDVILDRCAGWLNSQRPALVIRGRS